MGMAAAGLRRGWRRSLARAAEPQYLFPAIALVLVAALWLGTVHLVRVERETATRTVARLAGELADTYEAQVMRALREIDQSLRTIQYSHRLTGRADVADLRERGLLLPEILFRTTLADAAGRVVASTHEAGGTLAGPDFNELQGGDERLHIGRPERRGDEWQLHFTRRLLTPSGDFAGVAQVTVPAAYFVSGYETGKVGKHGLLALVGRDGVVRARRTGEAVSAGRRMSYAQAVRGLQGAAVASAGAWDDVPRLTAARELYEFPVAVVVGLGEAEQLAALDRSEVHYTRALLAGVLLVMVMAVLGRLSSRLARTRLLAHQARIDPLTGLANRLLLQDRIGQAIALSRRAGTAVAVVFIDVDRFKLVNDTLGHTAGDELLRHVASRLTQAVRASDTVARMGGDEFVLLLPGLERDAEAALDALVEKVVRGIAEPLVLGGRAYTPTCSVGVSTFPRDGGDAETLLRNADAAMYRAKELGRNRHQFFTEDVHRRLRARVELEAELRQALARGEFELHYQPQVSLQTGRIHGSEALLRWRHPRRGLVPPAEFVPLAEETGLIVPIGEWVLREACLQNKAWQREGLPAVPVSVNVSARQWDRLDIAMVTRALALSGLAPEYLELEITESGSMAHPDQSVRVMGRLKHLGVSLAIDDFGTGFSNLAYLRRFPVDRLKIDISFVRGIEHDHGSLAITDAILRMAHSIALECVAEGVETPRQAELLAARGCDLAQGYLASPPLPAIEYADLLARGTALPRAPHAWRPAERSLTSA